MSTDDIAPGTIALPDALEEEFAARVATGQKKTQVYRDVFGELAASGEIVDVSLRSRATRLSQCEHVASRIAYLKQKREKRARGSIPTRWTISALAAVSREATHGLTAALRAAEADLSVPESARSAIRREAVRHAGRVIRAGATRTDAQEPAVGNTSNLLIEALGRLQLCTCGSKDEMT